MKPFYFLTLTLIIAAVLVSCSKSDDRKPWDPNAMISLRPAVSIAAGVHVLRPEAGVPAGTKAETTPQHLTAKEIVEQAYSIQLINDLLSGYFTRGFTDNQRDVDNLRLLMYGFDVIDQFGDFVPDFIEGYDLVFTRQLTVLPSTVDTIAYIPNATLRVAETAIKAAYAKEDYEACYKIFDEAFTFIPITGAEWLALKAAGTN